MPCSVSAAPSSAPSTARDGWSATRPTPSRPPRPNARKPTSILRSSRATGLFSELQVFHELAHSASVVALMQRLIGSPVLVHPRKIARIGLPQDELVVGPHQDFPLIQGSADVLTCWVPVGDCPDELGGLRVLKGSHHLGVRPMVQAPRVGGLVIGEPLDEEPGWCTTDFEAGDALIFHSLTVHTAKHNHTDRLRLSVDFRYQSLRDPVVEGSLLPHYFPVVAGYDELSEGWTSTTLGRHAGGRRGGPDVRPLRGACRPSGRGWSVCTPDREVHGVALVAHLVQRARGGSRGRCRRCGTSTPGPAAVERPLGVGPHHRCRVGRDRRAACARRRTARPARPGHRRTRPCRARREAARPPPGVGSTSRIVVAVPHRLQAVDGARLVGQLDALAVDLEHRRAGQPRREPEPERRRRCGRSQSTSSSITMRVGAAQRAAPRGNRPTGLARMRLDRLANAARPVRAGPVELAGHVLRDHHAIVVRVVHVVGVRRRGPARAWRRSTRSSRLVSPRLLAAGAQRQVVGDHAGVRVLLGEDAVVEVALAVVGVLRVARPAQQDTRRAGSCCRRCSAPGVLSPSRADSSPGAVHNSAEVCPPVQNASRSVTAKRQYASTMSRQRCSPVTS